MKKMLVAGAALAIATAVVPANTTHSVNIVGFQKLNIASQFAMISPTLMTIGTTDWRLGDIYATGMDPFSDIVQVLGLATAHTTAMYTYIDLATAQYFGDASLVGWWDPVAIGEANGRRDHVVLPAGSGLLGNISSPGVTFTYRGELLDGGTQVVLPGQYVVLSNFLPIGITLGQVEAVGMNPNSDIVQDLSLTTANTTEMYTYVDLAAATDDFGDPSLVGWWHPNAIGEAGGRRDHVVLPAGSGLLSNISSTNVSFVFPDPTP